MNRSSSCSLSATLLTLVLASSHVLAQDATDAHAAASSTKVFHLANVASDNEANEVVTALRNVIEPRDKIFLLQSTHDVLVSASPAEVARVGQLISELDKVKHSYRLTYTLTESENGKRVGVQHFSMVALVGQHLLMKQGDKIPVVTGSFNTDKAAQQNQFTYLDIGFNLDTTLDQFANGLRLRSKIEQSSVAEAPNGKLPDDPIVRQSLLEGTSVITPGKPLILGAIDIVGSTRHTDIEVIAEPLP